MPPRGTAPGLSTTDGDARYQPLDSDLTAIAALSTTATGRNKLIEAAPVKDPSSPYSVASKVREIVFTAGTAKTVNLPALSDLLDLEIIWVRNQSASSITLTADPPTGATLNGGADGASSDFTVLARGMVGFQRLSDTTWGSVQPGVAPVSRIIADISNGAWRAAGYASVAGSWIRVTDYKAPTYTQDPETWGYSLSGTDIAVTTGAGIVNTALRTEAPGWGWALSAFGVGSLANQRLGTIDASVTSVTLTSAGTSDHNGVVGVYSTASDLSTGALYASGISKPVTNYAWIKGPASGVPVAYSLGTTPRRVQAMHLIPLLSGADPYANWFDGAGAIINTGGLTTANTAAGTPTHVGVFLVKLGTPRAGTIAAPSITFDLGSG